MATCHLFITVLNDGVGDFSHFVDIYNAIIKSPDLKAIEFVPVVCLEGNDEAKLKKINATLTSLNIPLFFSGFKQSFETHFQSNQDLINSLNKTAQVIFISADSLYSKYKIYINPNALLKTINEHEGHVILDVPNSKKCSLGLGEDCFGIKIGDYDSLTLNEATLNEAGSIIKANDPKFYNDLLQQSLTTDFTDFNKKNELIPAYFNSVEGFYKFLTFLATKEIKENDIALYFSGLDLQSEFGLACLKGCAKKCNVRIEVINNNGAKVIINPNAERVIRIFTGYFVQDVSYHAIYSSAKIAGVSGDNTLEYAVAHGILPFYYSTNFLAKQQTLKELHSARGRPLRPPRCACTRPSRRRTRRTRWRPPRLGLGFA